jgi:hypothetical protein
METTMFIMGISSTFAFIEKEMTQKSNRGSLRMTHISLVTSDTSNYMDLNVKPRVMILE